jgi:hypothetical protein
MRCSQCDETDSNPVSTVNVTSTTYVLGDDTLIEAEDKIALANGVLLAFTLAQAYAVVFFVAVGGVIQGDDQYTISGTTLTFTEPPPTGVRIIVKGLVVET